MHLVGYLYEDTKKEAVYLEFFAIFQYSYLLHDFSWNPYRFSAEPRLGNPDVYSQGVHGVL
jgi:hypothetical protein